MIKNNRFRVIRIGKYCSINDDQEHFVIVSGIISEAEAKYLCGMMNRLNDENVELNKKIGGIVSG